MSSSAVSVTPASSSGSGTTDSSPVNWPPAGVFAEAVKPMAVPMNPYTARVTVSHKGCPASADKYATWMAPMIAPASA